MDSAERWLELRGSTPDLVRAAGSPPEGTVVLQLDVQPFDRDGRTGARQLEPVAVGGSFAEGLDWAVRAHARAFIALASRGLERELVSYVVIRHPDGTYFFAGECSFRLLTEQLRTRFGPRSDRIFGRLIGMTNRFRIYRLVTTAS
jgi:hypothetical protein